MAALVFPLAGAALCAAAFLLARRRELGLEPRFFSEVFFVSAGAPPPPAAERLRAALPSQTVAYFVAGGRGPPAAEKGAWLFGPKPARGAPGVLPFGGAGSPVWFQPARRLA